MNEKRSNQPVKIWRVVSVSGVNRLVYAVSAEQAKLDFVSLFRHLKHEPLTVSSWH